MAAAPDVLLYGSADYNLRTIVLQCQDGGEPQLPDDPWVIPRYDGNLILLPGSHDIKSLEDELAQLIGSGEHDGNGAETSRLSFPNRTNRYAGAFRYMINAMVSKWQLDYVIIDCAPANSHLNKVITMTSDYILPPVFPDFFSMSSVRGLLSTVLPKWYLWRQQVTQSRPATTRLCWLSLINEIRTFTYNL